MCPRDLGRLMTRVLTMERQRAAPRSKRRKRTTRSWKWPNILMPNMATVFVLNCLIVIPILTKITEKSNISKNYEKLRSAAEHLQLSHQGIILLAKEVLGCGKINVRIPVIITWSRNLELTGGHYIVNQPSTFPGDLHCLIPQKMGNLMTRDKVQLSICQHFGTESQTLQRA